MLLWLSLCTVFQNTLKLCSSAIPTALYAFLSVSSPWNPDMWTNRLCAHKSIDHLMSVFFSEHHSGSSLQSWQVLRSISRSWLSHTAAKVCFHCQWQFCKLEEFGPSIFWGKENGSAAQQIKEAQNSYPATLCQNHLCPGGAFRFGSSQLH